MNNLEKCRSKVISGTAAKAAEKLRIFLLRGLKKMHINEGVSFFVSEIFI